MDKKTAVYGTCAVAVAVGIAAWGVGDAQRKSTPIAAQAPAATPHASVHIPTAVPMSQGMLPPPPSDSNLSKAQQFDAYAKAGTPADKFMAYRLAQACAMNTNLRRTFEMIPAGERTPELKAKLETGELKANQDAACGNLTDRQLSARTEYVKEAAEAGIPGAAIYLSSEPPFGDATAYETRPDDPAVLEYRRHIVSLIKLAALKGDSWSMVVLSDMYATGQGEVEGRDPAKALEYHIAARDAMANAGSKMLAYVDKKTQDLEQGLPVEQIEAAKKAGHTLALGDGK